MLSYQQGDLSMLLTENDALEIHLSNCKFIMLGVLVETIRRSSEQSYKRFFSDITTFYKLGL
jgi:hypothetical protein